VVVANLGTVYHGTDEVKAREEYAEYKRISESGYGRAAHEEVTLFLNGEPVEQHVPEPFAGQFMQPFIDEQDYAEVETSDGTFFLPESVCGAFGVAFQGLVDAEDRVWATLVDMLKPYVEAPPRVWLSIERKHGFVCRMSAAGYMDCTDWSAFDTRQEAWDHLVEQYGNGN
jgi:hypothetical protein